MPAEPHGPDRACGPSHDAHDPHDPDDPHDARTALAAAQHALLACLVTGASAPDGFDRQRLAVQARALLAKRARTAAAHHPWLAAALGEGAYRSAFADYARAHPLPAGGSHPDAVAFEAHLRAHGLLPRAERPRPRRRDRWRRRAG